jgi:ATP adenylyltransferase
MERLWAGWRMAYLRRENERKARDAGAGETPCLFCSLAGEPASGETLVLEKYEHSLLVLNAFPYTSGHVMVAPRAHHDSLLGSGAEERAEIGAALERARTALAEEYGPHGFNLGVNLGEAAGAGVIGHVHWHLVPRWEGDTNFLPVAASTRVLPEALPVTYERLLAALGRVEPREIVVRERGHGA